MWAAAVTSTTATTAIATASTIASAAPGFQPLSRHHVSHWRRCGLHPGYGLWPRRSLDAARTGPRMRHGNVKAGGIRGGTVERL